MILQALCGYYDRLAQDVNSGVALLGYAVTPVNACIVLDEDGNVVECASLQDQDGKNKRPMRLLVPQPPKRSGSKPEPAFLCENAGFLFGIHEKKDGAAYRFAASRERHAAILADVDDAGAKAVLGFFAKRTPGSFIYDGVDTSALETGGNIVFRLRGQTQYVHERPAVKRAWERFCQNRSGDAEIGQCLITGQTGPVAKLHPNFSGFGQDKPSIVTFNQNAFESHRKKQGANAPVSETAAFQYGTALNMLLADRNHYVTLGDQKIVFWAERDAIEEENLLAMLFDGQSMQEPETTLDATENMRIRGKLLSLITGRKPDELGLDSDVKIYVLGLSSNKTRLVIRFFHRDSFGDLIAHMRQHFEDMELIDARPRYPSLYRILIETAVGHEMTNVAPNLGSSLMRSILNGRPYPQSLYMGVIRRIRAEANEGNAANSVRVGVIKASLNRLDRRNGNEKEQRTMALDVTRTEEAYLLGRLFAALEKTQRDALGRDINASIVDKYLNSAMASPQTVFPTLLKLSEKHIAKVDNYYMKQVITELVSQIDHFSPALNARAQGEFLLGYYHQNKAFYTKREQDANQTTTQQ